MLVWLENICRVEYIQRTLAPCWYWHILTVQKQTINSTFWLRSLHISCRPCTTINTSRANRQWVNMEDTHWTLLSVRCWPVSKLLGGRDRRNCFAFCHRKTSVSNGAHLHWPITKQKLKHKRAEVSFFCWLRCTDQPLSPTLQNSTRCTRSKPQTGHVTIQKTR